MKNKIIYTVLSLSLMIMYSCYDDLSEFADERFDDLIATNTDHPVNSDIDYLEAYFGEKLYFDPQLGLDNGIDTTGLSADANYSFEWRMTQFASQYDTLSNVIGTKAVLDTVINMVGPNSQPYYLFLRATDNRSDMVSLFNWKVKVMSIYGEGLLVAETDDDQITDISLLMATAYNSDFAGKDTVSIKRNIYSQANEGGRLNGKVSQLAYLSYGTNKAIYALVKDEHLYGIEPLSMQIVNQDLEFFTFPPTGFKPQAVKTYIGGACFLNNKDDMHMFEMRKGQRFTYVSTDSPYDYSENFVEYNGGYYYSSHYKGPVINFDKNKGSFMGFSNYGYTAPYISNTNGAFDPTDVQDRELIYGDGSPNNSFRMLMKSSTSGDYFVYELGREDPAVAKKPIGRAIFDMSNCPDIKNATAYAFGRESDEFYYAVGNELRVAILNVTSPMPKVVYSLPAGEEISHLNIPGPNDKGQTTWDEDVDEDTGEMGPVWRASRNNLLTVASYDATKKEGFIRTLPIEYAGAGGIAAEKYVKVHGGFGRITAIIWKR